MEKIRLKEENLLCVSRRFPNGDLLLLCGWWKFRINIMVTKKMFDKLADED